MSFSQWITFDVKLLFNPFMGLNREVSWAVYLFIGKGSDGLCEVLIVYQNLINSWKSLESKFGYFIWIGLTTNGDYLSRFIFWNSDMIFQPSRKTCFLYCARYKYILYWLYCTYCYFCIHHDCDWLTDRRTDKINGRLYHYIIMKFSLKTVGCAELGRTTTICHI